MDRHTDAILSMMVGTIELYQEDLQRLTIIPYLHDDVFFAIKLKATDQYEKADDYTRLLCDRALSTILPRYLRVTRDDILGFSLFMRNGRTYSISKKSVYEDVTQDENQAWMHSVLDANGKAILLGNRTEASELYEKETQVFSVARMIKDPDSQESLGIIVADADTRVLDRSIRNLNFDVSFKVSILDRWKEPVYLHGFSPEDTASGEPIEGYRMSMREVAESGWQVCVYLSESELRRRTVWIFTSGFLLILCGIVVAISLYRHLTVSVVHPVQELLATMRNVESGDLQARFSSKPKAVQEMVLIGDRLNAMIQSLEFHIQQEYISRMKQQEAEYQMLQSQIKPHFLLNILNGFLDLNRSGEKKLLDDSIRNLAGMLRYIQQRQTMTTVSEEFHFIESYCHLQQLRFSDRMQFFLTLDEKAAPIIIPRLLVQPLVENAVIHGLEPISRRCTIRVSAKAEAEGTDTCITLCVEDDGAGFDPNAIDLEKSIGLGNCLERLVYAFVDATYAIEAQIGKGTKITMKFYPNRIDADESSDS